MATDPIVRRSGDLRALVGEHTDGPLEERFAGLVCDGCGAILAAPDAETLSTLTVGWKVAADLGGRDLCPVCADA